MLGCPSDPNQKVITIFVTLLLVPILKGLFLSDFSQMNIEYFLIFICGAVAIMFQFLQCDKMKTKYLQTQNDLNEALLSIEKNFNAEHGGVKMEY